MKRLAAILLLGFSAAAHAEIANKSGVTFAADPGSSLRTHYSVVIEGKCTGTFVTPSAQHLLSDIGISSDQLHSGVRCVAGDFDGNDFLDFAFFGQVGGEQILGVVLFNYGNARVQIIRDTHLGTRSAQQAGIGLWPAKYRAECGEPVVGTDSLIRWGDTDPEDRKTFQLWIYNPISEKMEKKTVPMADCD